MESPRYPLGNQQISSLLQRHPKLLYRYLSRERALHNVITRIRRFLDLNQLLSTTITEVRQLLNVDRVGILRLDPSNGWDEGTFIAESVLPKFDAALAKRVKDHCFGERYAQDYRQGKIHALNDIETAGLSDCHLQILRDFQVRANLLVPIIVQNDLWGLMCIHQCSGPRHWAPMDIEFAQQISEHLSMAIEHAELMEHTQHQAQELNQALDSLKRAHTQLAQAEKMSGLSRLAAGVAHEINNPVTFIQGNLDYVQQGMKSLQNLVLLYRQHCGDEVEEIAIAAAKTDIDFLLKDLPKSMESMQVGTQRIQSIVQALGKFARLDNEGLKPTDLNQELDNILILLENCFQSEAIKDLEIDKRYGSLPQVECHSALINQAFFHLLENAVDALKTYVPEASDPNRPLKITVTTTVAAAGTVSVAIHDNGPGIDPSRISKAQLFDPFFTTKPVGQGTGLGLAICYNIIQKHQGTIDYQSEPGKGTTFTIELPIGQSQ